MIKFSAKALIFSIDKIAHLYLIKSPLLAAASSSNHFSSILILQVYWLEPFIVKVVSIDTSVLQRIVIYIVQSVRFIRNWITWS